MRNTNPWIHLRFASLVRLTERRWALVHSDGETKLVLESPNGVRYDWKQGFIRKQTPKNEHHHSRTARNPRRADPAAPADAGGCHHHD